MSLRHHTYTELERAQKENLRKSELEDLPW